MFGGCCHRLTAAGTTPVAEHIFVYRGSDLLSPQLPRAAAFDPIKLVVELDGGDGARADAAPFVFTAADGSRRALDFGSPLQEVLSALGPPSRTFRKAAAPHKMRIHSLRGARDDGGGAVGDAAGGRRDAAGDVSLFAHFGPLDVCEDTYLNYVHLGIDVSDARARVNCATAAT